MTTREGLPAGRPSLVARPLVQAEPESLSAAQRAAKCWPTLLAGRMKL